MLAKAILTGGVLCVLSGAIVYFGTEGADALESNASDVVRIGDTELAGAPNAGIRNVLAEKPEAETAEAETTWSKAAMVEEGTKTDVQDPPPSESSKPKTKWLDQYLKKTKPETASDKMRGEKSSATTYETETEAEAEKEKSSATTYEMGSDVDEDPEELSMEDITEEQTDLAIREMLKAIIKKDPAVFNGARGEGKGAYIVSKGSRIETLDIEDLDIDAFDLYDSELDGDLDVDIDAILEELGVESGKNVKIRVVRKMNAKPSRPDMGTAGRAQIDYDMVLDEAKKLLVTDLRNQAFLEIVDHAIDQGEVMRAADIVDELSTPELRDTARARIGVGLARRGDPEAAFAVVDELEIDELSAPIRLEIITALMATKQEREAMGSQ